MCQKTQRGGHSFKDFILSVYSKNNSRETRIEACRHCGRIKQNHYRDFAMSLLALGVLFSINRVA